MDLIEQADNPKDRATLMILWELTEGVGQVAQVQKSLADDLEKHRKELTTHLEANAALVNKGRGFWRGLMISVGLLQATLVWQGKMLMDDYADVKHRIEKLESRYAALEVKTKEAPHAVVQAE